MRSGLWTVYNIERQERIMRVQHGGAFWRVLLQSSFPPPTYYFHSRPLLIPLPLLPLPFTHPTLALIHFLIPLFPLTNPLISQSNAYASHFNSSFIIKFRQMHIPVIYNSSRNNIREVTSIGIHQIPAAMIKAGV